MDLKGQKYNRLLVIGDAIKRGKNYYYPCRCECGKETLVRKDALVSGGTKTLQIASIQNVADYITFGTE